MSIVSVLNPQFVWLFNIDDDDYKIDATGFQTIQTKSRFNCFYQS